MAERNAIKTTAGLLIFSKFIITLTFNKTPYNTDGLNNCLLQPGQFCFRMRKSLSDNFIPSIKFCATRTIPATETRSIGLQADARVVMVFAAPPRQLCRDM
jgi:hypothetical protein